MFPSVKPIHPCQGEKGREADEAKLPLEQVDSAVPVRENNNDDDFIPGTPSSTAGADPEPGGSENQPSRGADKAADKNDANDTEVENEDNDDNNTKTNALQAADSADAYKTPDLSRSSSAASPKQENKSRCQKRFLGPEKALLFACVSIFFIFFSHRVIHVLCRLNKRLASRVGGACKDEEEKDENPKKAVEGDDDDDKKCCEAASPKKKKAKKSNDDEEDDDEDEQKEEKPVPLRRYVSTRQAKQSSPYGSPRTTAVMVKNKGVMYVNHGNGGKTECREDEDNEQSCTQAVNDGEC